MAAIVVCTWSEEVWSKQHPQQSTACGRLGTSLVTCTQHSLGNNWPFLFCTRKGNLDTADAGQTFSPAAAAAAVAAAAWLRCAPHSKSTLRGTSRKNLRTFFTFSDPSKFCRFLVIFGQTDVKSLSRLGFLAQNKIEMAICLGLCQCLLQDMLMLSVLTLINWPE